MQISPKTGNRNWTVKSLVAGKEDRNFSDVTVIEYQDGGVLIKTKPAGGTEDVLYTAPIDTILEIIPTPV